MCAKTGATTPTATVKWDLSFRRNSRRRDDPAQKRVAVRSAAVSVAHARRAVGRVSGPNAERGDDGIDDHDRDRDGGGPDPAAGLFRLARRATAQELAALGAGRRIGAFDHLAVSDHRRE